MSTPEQIFGRREFLGRLSRALPGLAAGTAAAVDTTTTNRLPKEVAAAIGAGAFTTSYAALRGAIDITAYIGAAVRGALGGTIVNSIFTRTGVYETKKEKK